MAAAVAPVLEVARVLPDLATLPPHLTLESRDGRLCLVDARPGAPRPLCVDFTAPETWRRATSTTLRDLLPRALGLKPTGATIVDATAGLGTDSLALARLGCAVICVERSKIIHALLEDGLQRSRAAGPPFADVAARLSLCHADSAQVLDELSSKGHAIDAILIDPMFGDDGKKAASRAQMQFLAQLADPDEAALPTLLASALRAAPRVAIKRPHRAAVLGKPRHQFEGKAVRFDVYFAADLRPAA
jgi:16S rRNA (guanine1516-N2)-methyltransferase